MKDEIHRCEVCGKEDKGFVSLMVQKTMKYFCSLRHLNEYERMYIKELYNY